ncbi:mutS protein homolog 4-like [Tetranychus urticae]|uniref:DNA mismatch repair proteins mutS family domain-containing protein n=1 Tax=Tetranychus urticae TaxID=32264 RepID=T1KMX8_TETUR|nr:mutS protein homolog 4-like [Tetranychus urticae]
MDLKYDFPLFTSNDFESESIRSRDWNSLKSISDFRHNSTGSISGPSSVSGGRTRSTIVSIAEGRGNAKGEIGLAAMDAIGSTLQLFQFPDGCTYSRLFSKLEILDPAEIIVSSTVGEGTNKSLLGLLLNFNNTITVTKVERKYFNDIVGFKAVTSLCAPDYKSKIEMEVKEKYYCLAAAAALIKYIEFVQNVILSANSIKVVYAGSEQTIAIDPTTAKALEIIVNHQTGKTEGTLLHFLDHTKTKVGYRLLRATIREPSSDLKTIEPRYDMISEILTNPQFHFNTSEIITKFLDLESIISAIICEPKTKSWKVGERRVEILIYLRHTLNLINPLREQLSSAQHTIFQHYYYLLEDGNFEAIANIIDTAISQDCKLVKGALNIKHQKVFAIKQDIDGFLDKKRGIYNKLISDMGSYVEQLGMKYNLPIKLNYNQTRGYHLTMNVGDRPDMDSHLPVEFIRVQKRGKTSNFTTNEMMRYNSHMTLALEDIFATSYEVLAQIYLSIREKIGCLHKLTEIVAFIDLLLSFSMASSKYNMVRPEFDSITAIKEACHPFLLENNKSEAVYNDAFLSEDCNIWILRGPNMSGKSTFLKNICVLQILAQCGCFVPAEQATFRLTDQIFTRVGNDDELESNCSTFTNEMKEIKYILDNYTDNSLIIIDELGKGTSYEEGLAVCWSVIESFLSSKAFVFCATHYSALDQMDSMYPNVTTHYFSADHRLRDEDNLDPLYGLDIAEKSGIKKSILEEARQIAEKMMANATNFAPNPASKEIKRKYQLGRHLITLASKPNLRTDVLNKYLKDFKLAQEKEKNSSGVDVSNEQEHVNCEQTEE